MSSDSSTIVCAFAAHMVDDLQHSMSVDRLAASHATSL
jgi:hypothetical protein